MCTALLFAGCAATSDAEPTLPLRARDGSAAAAPEPAPSPAGGWWSLAPIERARIASARGDLEVVAIEAWRARETPDDSSELRAIGAHAALAIDCADHAIELAGDTRSPELLRMIVRAHVTRDRWAEAAVVAASPELAEDEEARSVVAIARAAEGRSLWQVAGAPCAEAALRTDAPVPVVEVMMGSERALALVDTTTHTTRLARERAGNDGVLDTLAIGGVTISGVPYLARDLSRERGLATLPVDVVLGRDVLFRWRVSFLFGAALRLGGPPQYDIFHRDPETITLFGDTPAVCVWQTGRHSMVVGWAALDTTSASGVTIAQRMIDALPFAHEPGTDMSSLSLEVYGQSWSSATTVHGDDDFRFAPPIQMAFGSRALTTSQLGWRWYSSTALMSDVRACEAPMPSGPRTEVDCVLERLVETAP